MARVRDFIMMRGEELWVFDEIVKRSRDTRPLKTGIISFFAFHT